MLRNKRSSRRFIVAPRFLLINQQRAWSSLLDVVEISPDGEATFRQRLWGDFSQPLRLDDFPFDAHTFSIPTLALYPDGGPVPMALDTEASSLISSELSVADWEITQWTAEASEIQLTPGDAGPGFVFSFHAKRYYDHHVIKFIIPLVLIVMMSWIVFWMDPKESGSQLSVAVTAALTLIAYHIALSGKLPDIPYLTRMDLFLFGSTMLVFLALLEVVITSRLAQSRTDTLAYSIDGVCRFVFPLAYVLIAVFTLRIGGLS
ncbi:hypothetical protein [Congregibacter sp.]|uniref:hypothetical protein n=1 Tax=Congregibacter sp. TaxID=2744308 RepID=UPI003F6C308A